MGSFEQRAKPMVGAVAVWLLLTGWAAARQRSPRSASRTLAQPTLCCPPLTAGTCRECCNVPQANLALSPDEWPPACCNCDPCNPLLSACPNRDEYFILPPRLDWYAVADGAAMTRVPRQIVDFASAGPAGVMASGTSNIVLSTSDFSYDFKAAGRIVIGHTFGDCLQIEGSYFGIAKSENDKAVRDNTVNGLVDANGNELRGDLLSPFGGFGTVPMPNLDYNNLAQITYTSSLQSAELNVLRKIPIQPERLTMSILFGVRYITMPEDFTYMTQSSVVFPPPTSGEVTNTVHVTTDNQMIGPQVGARFELYTDNRWWLNTDIKAAVMNNNSMQSTDYTNVINGATGHDFFSVREDHTAFAGDLSVTAVYRWSPHFITRLGYQALWLEGMAMAPENFNPNIHMIQQGPPQLNHSSGVIYHGPFAGAMIGW